MIQKITDSGILYKALDKNRDIYTEKVRALADAYGCGYDFCGFYKQTGGTVISDYYGSAVVARSGVRPGDRVAELMEFLMCGKFRKVLMPSNTFAAAGVDANHKDMLLMSCENGGEATDDIERLKVDPDAPLSEISDIISAGFDIDVNKWYTDMSHNLRHRISQIYVLEHSACAVKLFASSGIAYLSYVSTRREARGKGLASRLVSTICADEASRGNTVQLFCSDGLRPFYANIGFASIGKAVELTI
ncbi:MAG: GNAT family N-acetyltransferase [Ruminiclostridium sp.]|nr:GNAT family N-acetyltransferase [Ruminiclostridium sp.]